MMTGADIRRKAVQLLLDLNVDRLPIDPFDIADKLNIPVIEAGDDLGGFMRENAIDAVCYSPEGKPAIFYDGRVTPPERIRFSIAHELGHIVLKHISVNEKLPRQARMNCSPLETEANSFAAELLAPQGLLYATGLYPYPWKIKEVFGVSYSMAKARSERLKGFSHRYINKLEQKLSDQFFE